MFAKPLAALALLFVVPSALAQAPASKSKTLEDIAAENKKAREADLKAAAAAGAAAVKDKLPGTEEEKKTATDAIQSAIVKSLAESDTEQAKAKHQEQQDEVKSWFVGAGLGARFNLGGERVSEVGLAELSNGDLVAQVRHSDENEIRILFESHFLFKDVSVLRQKLITEDAAGNRTVHNAPGELLSFSWLGALAQCGFFALSQGFDQPGVRGCGPFVAVAFDKDASPEEFAIGHMISYGGDGAKPFNLGYGVIFDPDSVKLDGRLFVPGTMTIRPEFRTNVLDGTIGVTQREESVGFLILFSTNF